MVIHFFLSPAPSRLPVYPDDSTAVMTNLPTSPSPPAYLSHASAPDQGFPLFYSSFLRSATHFSFRLLADQTIVTCYSMSSPSYKPVERNIPSGFISVFLRLQEGGPRSGWRALLFHALTPREQ
ncbi:unnamed protein product [Leuciscus chuanchicus]